VLSGSVRAVVFALLAAVSNATAPSRSAGRHAMSPLRNAVQSGPLVASQPALPLDDALVSLSPGITLYAERVRTGWWLVAGALGAALILYGAVPSARQPLAQVPAAPPAEDHNREHTGR
jgi:hypothetical protein